MAQTRQIAFSETPNYVIGELANTAIVHSKSPIYFLNWWADFFFAGGASILLWIVIIFFQIDVKVPFTLLFFANFPHFSATIYRLYQSPQHTRQFPVTAWGLPFLFIALIFSCFRYPEIVFPYLGMLYLFWSPYHYAGQTIGLTTIYARRSGFVIGRTQRLALTSFLLSTVVYAVTSGPSASLNVGMPIVWPSFPGWLGAAAQTVMCVSALVFAGFAVAFCIHQKRLVTPIVFLPALAQFIWFVPGPTTKTFFLFVPVFHSLQYLLIACLVQLKVRLDVEGAERSWKRVRAEALRWGVRNVVGGTLLFVGLPLLFSRFSPLAIWVVVAAVNIHHFFVDGVIWKLRDSSNASALMTNIVELSRPPVTSRAA